MFYPEFKRRDEVFYHSNRKEFYASYHANYKYILEDCLERCAYCDITVNENGGDAMHLDHFRPQRYFGMLKTHPYNLYLCCPKCNGLKKDDWPALKIADQPSYVGAVGYLDRFQANPSEFLTVGEDGKITPLAHPIGYMVKKLQLNRSSRVNVRRKRQLEARKEILLEGITVLMAKIDSDLKSGRILRDQALSKFQSVSSMMIAFRALR